MKGVTELFFSLAGDNMLFAFEATKSISTGLTLGLVYNTSGTEIYREIILLRKLPNQFHNHYLIK